MGNLMIELFLLIVVVVCLFGLIGKRSHPTHMKGLRGITARQCPSCRTPISHNASYCPHCGQETKFSESALSVSRIMWGR
jgi:predicted amidophosphoribosyltransferase